MASLENRPDSPIRQCPPGTASESHRARPGGRRPSVGSGSNGDGCGEMMWGNAGHREKINGETGRRKEVKELFFYKHGAEYMYLVEERAG